MKNQEINKYYIKDARDLDQVINGQKVDVIITSPPYGTLKDYGVENQIGYGQDYELDYLNSLKKVFHKCFNITKKSGSLWVVADTFKRKGELVLFPFDIAKILNGIGWILKDIIIWDKGKTLPWSKKGYLRNTFEYILFFVKSNRFKYYIERIRDPNDLKKWWVQYPERYNPMGKVPKNIWKIPIPTQGSFNNTNFRHFCPFPPEIVEKILLLTTNKNDVVLDPFAGSGMVLAQANVMERRYIGFDIKPEYKDMYKNEVKEIVSKRWELIKDKIKDLESGRNQLQSKIHRLRLLKYPKVLVKRLNNELKDQDIKEIPIPKVIIAIKKKFNSDDIRKSHHFLKINIFMIYKNLDDVIREEIKDLANEVINRKPLSKYGILSKVIIKDESELVKLQNELGIKKKTRLFIYLSGNTHKYFCSKNFENWMGLIRKEIWIEFQDRSVPPILSNIKIKQDLPISEDKSTSQMSFL